MVKITVFKSIDSDSQSQYFEIQDVLYRIKKGNNRHLIEQIRSEQNKQKRDQLKKRLFWICFSGEFTKRNNESMVKHSGFICLDFDAIPANELQLWRTKIQSNPHTYACFISPSGNGLKVIWLIPECSSNDEHNRRFEAIAETFKDCRYFDHNVKGWSRVCFESYDPLTYVNQNAKLFHEIAPITEIKTQIQNIPAQSSDTQRTFNNLVKWFEQNHNMRKGNRNQGAFTFASGVAEYIRQDEAEPMLTNYIMQNVEQLPGDPFTHEECQTCIRHAYRNNPTPRKVMSEHDNDAPNVSTRFSDDLKIDLEWPDPEEDETELVDTFWFYSGRGSIKVDYLNLKKFLEQNGFFKYRFNPEDISFIRVVHNVIEVTTIDKIKDFVLDFLMKRNETAAYNLFAADSKFEKKYISFLAVKEPKFIRDIKLQSWVFYRNTAVSITCSGIECVKYIDIDGYIWKTQIIDRDFSLSDYECDFAKFLLNVSGRDDKRCRSLMSGMGYFMHRFKDPSTVRALVFNEELITSNPAGGTGKGLVFLAMSKIRNTVFIDGKTVDFNNRFIWQRVGPDTDNVILDDPPKTFKFESVFSILTTGWPISKLYKGEIYLEPENSPKIGIPTNNVLKGSSSSHERRKFEVEFHPHYSDNFQPIDDFGRNFWNDWDLTEWLRFDNLMMQCIKLYLTEGLIKADYVNLKIKKVISDTSEEFVDFAKENLKENKSYHRNETFSEFVKQNPGSYCKSASMFYEWMREWGKYNGWDTKDSGAGRMYIQYGEVTQEEQQDDEVPF